MSLVVIPFRRLFGHNTERVQCLFILLSVCQSSLWTSGQLSDKMITVASNPNDILKLHYNSIGGSKQNNCKYLRFMVDLFINIHLRVAALKNNPNVTS